MSGRPIISTVARYASSSSSSSSSSFRAKNVHFIRTPSPKTLPAQTPSFGSVASDHMLEVDFANGSWQSPVIRPVEDLLLNPLAKVLHYCPTIFEGMKAFRGVGNKIRLFRPEANMKRFLSSAKRAALPTFCPDELQLMIEELVRKDARWVPDGPFTALYIRPFLMGTDASLGVAVPEQAKLLVVCCPVGPYYASGWKPIKLYADPSYIRAAPGGVGAYKMGCNYAPTVQVAQKAAKYGCQQVLWLWGEQRLVTEVGTSNIFLLWKNKNGELELITPPVEGGLILPGVTRDSVLALAKEWREFKVTERYPTMAEISDAAAEGRILELFGTGTAAVVTPCEQVVYVEKEGSEPTVISIPPVTDRKPLYKRIHETITGIQYGKIDRPQWVKVVQ